ncbi:hypothetical protein BIY37_12375 [Candidatus Brocadia sapporoensis]|uniref:Uncharacterized protein n=1 Tax=Candidatus Brocadia sapporoensis TaxID=392547 RepID=A0A1V6LX39_9BACT|nr:hypothetical protein BIY37_12375 [Candidatus Brocadia sapporoensis]
MLQTVQVNDYEKGGTIRADKNGEVSFQYTRPVTRTYRQRKNQRTQYYERIYIFAGKLITKLAKPTPCHQK